MSFICLARRASWAVLSLVVLACSPNATPSSAKPAASIPVRANPLPSWNDGPARTSILDFVRAVTSEGSADFVPVPQRIAAFDNDGTLWSEQPMYFQLLFVLDRVRGMAADHPEWKTREPFKSAIAGDMKGVMAAGEKGIVQMLLATHTGMTIDEFDAVVREWMATARQRS